MKKVLLLAGVFLLMFTMSVCAEDFAYKIVDNEVVIVDYTGEETEIAVPDTIDGYAVTRIGDMAFSSAAITAVDIPEGVEEIGTDAFWNCTKLERVNLPDSITRIEKNAFANCRSLKEIKLPEKLEFIGHGAFVESGLTRIVIPESVSVTENCTFQKCMSLEEVILPEGLTVIPANFCYGCESLKNVNIPQSVTKIGAAAFQHCTSLEEIILPDTVTDIGARAFGNCASLKEINIPDGLTVIENQTFSGLVCVKEIIIPEGVETISDSAFAGCENAERIVVSEKVTAIGVQAFAGNNKMTEITLPESLKEIGLGAFMNNTALKEVYIPQGVEKLGEKVFAGCTNLEKITVSEENEFFTEKYGVVYSKDFTRMYFVNPSLEGEVSIPEGVAKIPEEMFKGTKITRVTMPDSVTDIGTGAFADCGELEILIISDNAENILSHTLQGSKKLKWVVIGEKVTDIKSEAFYDCEIENVVFKNKDTKITRKHWFTTGGNNSSVTLPAFEGFYETNVNTLFGYKDSDAESYANERGFKFVDIEKLDADTYEDSAVLVYDDTAWVWTDGKLYKRVYNIKDALITRYIGSNEDVILCVSCDNTLTEDRGNSTAFVMKDVHSIRKDDGRIYIQTTDGRVFERVYSNAKAENVPCDEKTFENTSISVYVDGKLVQTDSEPYIKNDRTMVPMRAIFEALGASVSWYQAEKIATGTKGNIEVAIKIGDKVLYKNGESVVLDAEAEIKNDRTMVPVRAISEAFGCSVSWDDKTKSVIITGVDKAWDYTYLAEKADKATYYWKIGDEPAESGKSEDKETIKKLLQFLADSDFKEKEYDGVWYESGERRSFSVYAKGSVIISVEIGKEEVLINSAGKIRCYDIESTAQFQSGVRKIFGIDNADKAKSVFYKYFSSDVKDEIVYFQTVNKSVENERFVMSVNEVCGNTQYMYITVSIKAKNEESKVYLKPDNFYGEVKFDLKTDGAIAKNVYGTVKYKWIEEDGAKVFLYKIRSGNYGVVSKVKVNSATVIGEDISFEIIESDEKLQIELKGQGYEGGYLIVQPMKIVLTFNAYTEDVETFFRFKDGSVKTINQLGNRRSATFLTETESEETIYEYTYATSEVIDLSTLESVIVKGIEYSFENPEIYEEDVEVPDELKPFHIFIKTRTDDFGNEYSATSLKELAQMVGGWYRCVDVGVAEVTIWGKTYRITDGEKKYIVDNAEDDGIRSKAPVMDENNVMWVDSYDFIRNVLKARYVKTSDAIWTVIP